MGNKHSVEPVNNNCPACFERINNNQIILKCGHQLCSDCVYRYIKSVFINQTLKVMWLKDLF